MAVTAFELVGRIFLQGGERVENQLNDVSDSATKSSGIIGRGLGGAMKLAGAAALGLGTAVVAVGGYLGKLGMDYNATQEQSKVAWTTLLGGAEKAEAQMKRISDFAKSTPFETGDVDMMAKYMHNAGLEGQGLFDALMQISDVSSAFNISIDDTKEMARQMSQVRQAGVAYTEDLNVLADRGVPIYKELAKQLNTNTAGVKKMASEGKLSGDIYLKAFNNIAGGVKGASEAQSKTFNGMLSTMQDNLKIFAGTLMSGAFQSAKKYLEGFNTALGWLTELVTEKGVGGAIQEIINKVQGLIPAFGGAGDGMKGIFQQYTDVWNNISDSFGEWRDKYEAIMQGLWTAIQYIFSSIAGIYMEFMAQLAPTLDEIVYTWDSFMLWATDFWKQHGEKITATLKIMWDRIVSVIKSAISIVQNIIRLVLNILQGDWAGAWENIKQIAIDVWNILWTTIKSIGLAIWIWIGDWVMSMKDSIVNGWNSMVTAVKNIMYKFVEFHKTIAKNIIEGLVNGIKNGASFVVEAAKNMVSNVKDTVTGFLGIKSPSKVTEWIGNMLGQGMTVGIEDSSRSVLKSAAGLAHTAMQGLSGFSPARNLAAAGAGAGGAAGALAGGGAMSLEIPLYIDNKEVARAIAPRVDQELAKRKDRQSSLLNRGNL